MNQEAPGWSRVVRLLAGRTLDRLERHVRVAMTEEFDPARFRRSARYRLFMFASGAAGA